MEPTKQQLQAIESNAKQILCVAGPGSGKTFTLIQRILRLIRAGVRPDDIAVIVYTNEAARIIHDRLHPKSGEFAINLGFVGTLHSFCLRHLQKFGGMSNVTVLDEEEADAELLRCAQAAAVKASPKDLTERRKWWGVRQYDERKDAVHIAVASYYRQMDANRALDFNAILTKAREHLQSKCPQCGGKDAGVPQEHPCPSCASQPVDYSRQRAWKHLLVDEFQDATRADFETYMVICSENRFFVGDPDQGIFGWRGGDITGIMSIAESADWEKVLLEGNFRSGPAICTAAQRLIEHDQRRVRKATISLTDRESTVGSQSLDSDVHEAVVIAGTLGSKEVNLNEVAVLARTNSIADFIASTLSGHGIPVRKRRVPVMPGDWKQARAALRMLQARNDDSILRWITVKEDDGGIAAQNARHQSDLGQLKLRAHYMAGLECRIDSVGRDLVRLRIGRESVERIEKLRDQLPDQTMGDLVLASVQDFEYEEQGEGVFCTTIHGAKGREWDTVILAGFEEETIPGRRFLNIEEERRIAYVGMTRARTTLRITWVKARRENWGRRDYKETTISQFIREAGLT